MSKDVSKLHGFLNSETVLTIATADACGAWSAPVLYVADTQAEPFELYFLSSSNSRHISGLPLSGSAAVSIYTEVKALIDRPASEQETRIGQAFGKSHFYLVTPSFVRFTNNSDSFAGRTEWQF